MSIATAVGFVSLVFFIGGFPPPMKRMRDTKPMAMAMPMPILIGTFGYFFSKWFSPISSVPSSLFGKFYFLSVCGTGEKMT